MTRRFFLAVPPCLALAQDPDLDRVRVGNAAPDFSATTASGESWRLSRQRGNSLVLVFYRGYW